MSTPISGDAESHLPPHHQPLPELRESAGRLDATEHDFARVQASENFTLLKKRFRSFAFPLTVAFLVWYFAYVLLSTYAKGAMSTPVIGNLNLGLLLGLGQFVTTFAITGAYIHHANKNLDPLAAEIRAELEGDTK